jgi:chlorobactene glucosyltransferase
MSLALGLFFLFEFLILAIWVLRHSRLTWVLEHEPILFPEPPRDLVDPPLVSIIVPARNEEANIAECLDSLVAQSYPRREVIVVDDRSEDGTADVVRGHQARFGEVRLVQVSQLPPGWTGKTHALAQATREARGEWFLFVDADIRLDPDNLASTLTYVREHGLEFLSLLPRADCRSFWEGVLQPLLGIMLMLRFPLSAVNDPSQSCAFANGQYILIRRSTYEALGGHTAVSGELLEDIALAQRAKAQRLPLAVVHGYRIASVRMYGSFPDIWRGWRRIYIHALGRRARSLLLSAGLIVLFSLNPLALALAGVLGLLVGAEGGAWLAAAAVGVVQVVAMMSLVYRMYRQLILAQARYLLFYPVAMLVGLGLFLDALLSLITRRELVWRGTAYPVRTPTR